MTGALAADTASLLPPNATSLERALEILSRRLDRIPTPIRELADHNACPPAFLPWLAFTRSVDAWSPDWNVDVKRGLIAASIDVHRHKGTAASVRAIVQAFGGQVAIREWWETTPKGPPGTFELVLTLSGEGGEPASAAFVDEVIAQVARVKPARAWFSATQGISAAGGLAIKGAGRALSYARLSFEAFVPPVADYEGALDFSYPANSGLIGLL